MDVDRKVVAEEPNSNSVATECASEGTGTEVIDVATNADCGIWTTVVLENQVAIGQEAIGSNFQAATEADIKKLTQWVSDDDHFIVSVATNDATAVVGTNISSSKNGVTTSCVETID